MSNIGDEIQSMLDDIRNEYQPLLDTDFTRQQIAAEFNLSPNGARGRARKMVQEGKWIETMKRSPNGSLVATYKKVIQ